MKYGERSEDVRTMQEGLITKGYRVGTPDGILGAKTWAALIEYAADTGQREPVDKFEDVPADLWDDLVLPPLGAQEAIPSEDVAGVRFIDLRHEQDSPIPRSRVAKSGRATVMRDPKTVTGVCLHQMACTFGVTEAQLKAAGGDRQLAKARRMMNVPAHACASRESFVTVHSPLAAFLHHGHAFNEDTLGLEIEGQYAGVEGDLRTAWKGVDNGFGPEVLASARAALRYLVVEGRRIGMPIKWAYAHRQTYAMKRSDPGSAIWQRVVLDYGVPVLGLVVRSDHTRRDGRPIPHQWDAASGVGKY